MLNLLDVIGNARIIGKMGISKCKFMKRIYPNQNLAPVLENMKLISIHYVNE